MKVSHIISKLSRSDFIRNVLLLLSGNAIAQIITVGSSPIITRLYTPENFGIFALFFIFVDGFGRIGSLCYHRAIVLPEKNKEAIRIVFIAIAILLTLTLLMFLFVYYFNKNISNIVNNKEFSFWILFTPIGVLFYGLLHIFRFWRLRKKEFNSIAFSHVLEASVSVTIKIMIGLLIGASSGGLISGGIVGLFVATAMLMIKPEAITFKGNFEDVTKQSIVRLAKNYKSFPYFACPTTLLNYFYRNVVIIAFSIWFPPALIGYYSLGVRVLKRPVDFLTGSIQNVYFQKSANIVNRKERLYPSLKKMLITLVGSGLIPFLICLIWGRELFERIFGSNWETAGMYVQIMSPLFFVLFIGGPSKVLFEVCQKQDIRLMLNIITSVLSVLALAGGYLVTKDAKVMLIYFVSMNILCEFIIIRYAISIALKFDKNILE